MANVQALDISEVTIPDNVEFQWNEISTEVRQSKRFRRKQYITKFKVNHNLGDFNNIAQVSEAIDLLFLNMVHSVLVSASRSDLVSAAIFHNELASDIYIPPQKVSEFKKECFTNAIEKVAQSNRVFLLNGEFTIDVAITENVHGSGRKNSKAPLTVDMESKNKTSIVTIKNKDNSCGYRAIYVGKYYIDNKDNLNKQEWKFVRKNSYKVQDKGADKIAQMIGLDIKTPLDIDGLKEVQKYLSTNYQLIVIDGRFKTLLFKGENADKKIYLLHTDNHYDVITNIKGYMNKKFYCETCHVAYNKVIDHKCKHLCNKCYSNCSKLFNVVYCDECKRDFNGNECYNNHLILKICNKIKKCTKCLVEYKRSHECEVLRCKNCKIMYKGKHFCYIKPNDEEKLIEEDKLPKIIVAFDIESMQIKTTNNLIKHVPNLLICDTACNNCWNNNRCDKGVCDICPADKNVYFGTDCIKKFVDYLFVNLAQIAVRKNAIIYVFAHNARGYDSHFILRELWNQKYKDMQLIMNGRKILKITVGNIRLLDSLSFFLQPLASLPKAFGLDVNIEKGHFPHLFNIPENWNYEGTIPDIQYYGISLIKANNAKELRGWHAKQVQNNVHFNFKDELIKYCKNDVDILLKCLMVFRFHFIKITNIDPITRCFTLASIGLEVFRAKYLPPDTLGVTPVKGYNPSRKHSMVSNCWLDWMQKIDNCKILREYKIGSYFADGYCEQSNTIYEFFGCFYHGCLECYPDRSIKLIDNKTANELYIEVQGKLQYYKDRGYNVKFIWECAKIKEYEINPLFKKYTRERYRYYSGIKEYCGAQIREAFFGGRTNNLKFYYEVKEGEEIKYVDFCSLYPYVLKTKSYPLKHPEVISESFDKSLKSYFGFVKCKILPPKGLYLPVLPVSINKKLMFPLCYTCVLERNNTECYHSIDGRALVGTWTTAELLKALEKGYLLIEIYEVLNYGETTSTLFASYVNMWLKIKQQASGWPKWCQSEADKEKYINDYKTHEGIQLDYDKIDLNPALRFIAKIMLNSFWGKLAQRPNLPKTEMVTSYDQYWELATNSEIEITSEIMVTEDLLMLNWKYIDDSNAKLGNYCLAVAAYVTAYARLELYNLMDKIERIRPGSVLYHDTDSVLYIHKHTDEPVKCGDYLGDLTDEIVKDYGPESKCVKFVSLGPKNYAYEIKKADGSTNVVMKVKGISLNESALNIITFAKLVELAIAYCNKKSKKLLIPQQQINSDAHQFAYTRYFDKVLQAVSEKRCITGNDTLPYGY